MLRHKAFCAAVRPVRVQRWPIRCRAAPAADPSLLERLQQAETSADWATALEVVTEAKVAPLLWGGTSSFRALLLLSLMLH